MFKALHSGSTIGLAPRSLTTLQRSTNMREMTVGGGKPGPKRAAILGFFDRDADAYRLFVFIGDAHPDEFGQYSGILFQSEPNVVPANDFAVLLHEGGKMVRQQGFEMDTIDLSDLTDIERVAALRGLPFGPPAPPTSAKTGRIQARTLSDVSGEISLPRAEAISTLGELLSLF